MFVFQRHEGVEYRNKYWDIASELNECKKKNDGKRAIEIIRWGSRTDLFFLLYFVMNRVEMNHPWLVKRIYEAQDVQDRTLDLWARYHYKTTIITIARTVKRVLNNPNHRHVIISQTRNISKSFLRRIKEMLETNILLKTSFIAPDEPEYNILFKNPQRESVKWSEDEGLTVRRTQSFQEATIEAWSLDQLPTGMHYEHRIYDDPVTKESVTTSTQREKTSERFRHSHALKGNTDDDTVCVIGTRYHFSDLYSDLIKSGEWRVREYAATRYGDFPAKPLGADDNVAQLGMDTPVFMSPGNIWQEFKDMGRDVFATQMLLNPRKESDEGFEIEWFKQVDRFQPSRNYIFVDPAGSEKKKESSFTVMWVIGIDRRGYIAVKDGVRDKLNLKERCEKLFAMVEKYDTLKVYYEKYSMQGDIEYIEEKQKEQGFPFKIEEVKSLMSKDDRIKRLQPLFQEGRILFPRHIWYVDSAERKRDLVKEFIEEEYLDFPNCGTKDMLDCLARIRDENTKMFRPVYKAQDDEVDEEPYFLKSYSLTGQYDWAGI